MNVGTQLRFNGPRWAMFAASIALAFGFMLWADHLGAGSPWFLFLLTLAGASLAAAGKTVVDISMRRESYRQGAYTERAKAVQLVLREARGLKSNWLESLMGRVMTASPPEIGALEDEAWPYRQILDELARTLLLTTWDNRVWIGRTGDRAVRTYIDSLGEIREDRNAIRILPERARLEVLVNAPFGMLESELMEDLGFTPR